jgi:hypothetical protein
LHGHNNSTRGKGAARENVMIWQQNRGGGSAVGIARRECRGHRWARPATGPRIAAAAGLGQDQDRATAAAASVNQT